MVNISFNVWTLEDKKLAQLNSKCLYHFFYTLQIWDMMYVMYEGSNEVKHSRANILMHDYELFIMLPMNPSNVYTYFTEIVTLSHALGHEISNFCKLTKIEHYLTESWDDKMMAISKSKVLSIYLIVQFLGSLITHEKKLSYQKYNISNENKKKVVAFKMNNSKNSDQRSSSIEHDDM